MKKQLLLNPILLIAPIFGYNQIIWNTYSENITPETLVTPQVELHSIMDRF
jgi:hypothetical protein